MAVSTHAAPVRTDRARTKSIIHRAARHAVHRGAQRAVGIEPLENRRLMSATLTLVNPDVLPGSDRLIFNYVQNPNAQLPNVVHSQQTLEVEDTGTTALTISSIKLSGPFAFVGAPTGGYTNVTVNPGSPLTLNIAFTQRSLPAHSVNETDAVSNPNGGAVIDGSLTITSNASNTPTQTVALAGYWQSQSENNSEPNLTTITNLLAGYDTTISNPYSLSLPNGNTTTYYGQEVIASSWKAADATQPVAIQELSSFRIQGSTVNTYWYAANSQASTLLMTSVPAQGQTLLPTLANGQLMTASFTPNGTFGFRVDNEYSNDAINSDSAHHFRFYPVIDSSGNAVANTWIVAEDAGAFNYQDNVYVVSNMQPVTAPPAPTNLTATNAADPVLSWTGVTYSSLAGYNVYRSTSATGTFTKLTTTPISTTTFTDTASPPTNTTLYYRVTAVDSLTGDESAPATATANTTTGPFVVARAVNTYSAVATSINLLTSDTDTTGTLLPYTLVVSTNPNHGGTVTIDTTTGVATYTSTSAFAGTETFSYTIGDSNGATSTPATVTITVSSPALVAPIGEPTSVETLANTAVVITPVVRDSTGNSITPASVLLANKSNGTLASSVTTAAGTATVNSNGTVTFTPTTNFVGGTAFFYQATDSNGNVTGIVPMDVNIGVAINTLVKGGSKVILYKDANGTAVTLSLSRGIADVYFNGAGTTAAPVHGKITLAGSSLTIHEIALSGTTVRSTLSIATNRKGNVTLGSVSDSSALGSISAKTTNLAPDNTVASTGTLDLAGVRSIALLTTKHAQITVGAASGGRASLTVYGAADTTALVSSVPVSSISVGAWNNATFSSEIEPSSITAPSIGTLVSKGEFDANLILSSSGRTPALNVARITGPVDGGAWNIIGSVHSVSLTTVTSGWAGVNVSGILNAFSAHSGISSQISAGSINSLSITGTLSGDVTTAGNLLSLRAAQLVGATIDVGNSVTNAAAATALNIGTAKLNSLVLTSKLANTFSDSSVIADLIGSIVTGPINTTGTNEGIAAAVIKGAVLNAGGIIVHVPKADLVSDSALQAFLASKSVSLGTFAIDIL